MDNVPSVVRVGFAPLDDSESTFALGRFGGIEDELIAAFAKRGEGEAAGAGRAAQCAVRGRADAKGICVSPNFCRENTVHTVQRLLG